MNMMAVKTHNRTPAGAKSSVISRSVLRWYEKNARSLPWRVTPAAIAQGVRPEPYHVWLSEIMLQQTTVATVTPRYHEFLQRWPSVNEMAAAPVEDILGQWAGLGYYARARNLHKCAVLVASQYSGHFPDTEEELRTLPGIGDYTAAAIAAIAFDRRAIVIDGNIERIVSRLFEIETPLPAAKTEIKTRADEFWPTKRSGDFAQGLMDLGATICRPKAPLCLLCPLSKQCRAFASGTAETLPVKAPKKQKPTRHGAAFAMQNSKGEMLFERRPDKGLLGGMLGLPGSPWQELSDGAALTHAPAPTAWEKTGKAYHTFTHFHLVLDVYTTKAPKGFRKKGNQQWVHPDKAQLPTVMRKAVEAAVCCDANKSCDP